MIKIIALKKSFGEPPNEVLKGIDLEIPDGKFVSISGKSGSGKSTLLYCLSSLDNPSSGAVLYDGRDLGQYSEKDIHQFRNQSMGFVFQFHYLLSELTALDNVLMPARKINQHLSKLDKAKDLLDKFDLEDKCHRFPKQLSGGEQQRVAIARALIMDPKYLFADEPTGNLDSQNAKVVMDILKEITRTQDTTVIYVTHDADFAKIADTRIFLKDGKIDE